MLSFSEKTDSQIQQDVLSELTWDPSVTSSQLSVTTNDGIVTLRGSVPHYFEKSRAENAAERVTGVRALADEIEVTLMGSYLRSDEQIAEAALNALAWSYSVPKGLKVVVEKGWITLKGETEWDYQRKAAGTAVSSLMGVCGVTNKISIKSKVQSSDIQTRIKEALKRSASKEGKSIDVSVDGHNVILTGDVRSLSERRDVIDAVWMAPGVKCVENNLKVKHQTK